MHTNDRGVTFRQFFALINANNSKLLGKINYTYYIVPYGWNYRKPFAKQCRSRPLEHKTITTLKFYLSIYLHVYISLCVFILHKSFRCRYII